MDAGHFIPKNKGNSVYFLEDNVYAQCPYCNRYLHGNLYEYGKALETRFHKNKPNQLKMKSMETLKLNKQYYEIQIEKYKKLVKELRETKGII
jgi:hypothetical protein